MSNKSSFFSHPFSTTWKKALISLPRLVPDSALYITSPEGPQPFVVKIPSFHPRNHDIPCYVFMYIPPRSTHATPSSASSKSPSEIETKVGKVTKDGKSTVFTTTSCGDEVRTLNLPVLIDFHGGSFILGTPQEQAPFCAQMARELGASASGGGCVVISVYYRLGPYSHYPAANEDAEDIIRTVLEGATVPGKILREAIREQALKQGRDEWVNLDTKRIAISGFSSGGNMALGTAISVRNDPTIGKDWPSVIPCDYPRGIPLLLFFPSLDSRLLPDERPRPPGLEPPAGFFTRLKIESELMPKYMPTKFTGHPRASPGLAPIEGLHQKAKIMLVLPELDSLSSQSLIWVKKVEDEGRKDDLTIVPVPKMMHGWTQFPDSWLKTEEERTAKYEVFRRAREFVEKIWADLPVDMSGSATTAEKAIDPPECP
jgi:acetyl esterase/lipase